MTLRKASNLQVLLHPVAELAPEQRLLRVVRAAAELEAAELRLRMSQRDFVN